MNGREKPILHLNDWYGSNGRRNAAVQIDTKNDSFVRMAVVLKKMGIKNHLFHLSLLDPALMEVDPHSLDDVNDSGGILRLRVAVECKRNPWYFFREVCRIRAPGGTVPFKLHRGNLAMLWCFFSNLNFTSTQPRQTGKSICAVAICAYVLYIAGKAMDISMLTLNNNIVQANVKRVKDIRENLPKYLVHDSPGNLDNKQGLYYKKLDTKYMTYCGQQDRRAAQDVGRGATSPMIHYDEPPFVPNIDVSMPVIASSTDAAKASAKAKGQYYANIFTTTAGDPSTTEGKYIYDYVKQAMKFTERLYDTADNAGAHAMVAMNSTNGLVNGTFSYLQLGLSHEWFEKVKMENNLSQTSIARDYHNKWISLAETPILDKEVTNRMYATKRDDPMFAQVFGDYIINWYVPRERVLDGTYRNRPLVMGMDTSEMIGRDFSTCVAIDPTDLSVVFTFRCNESNTAKFAVFIADLLAEYSGVIFVPERKSTAIPIIDKVIMVMQSNGQNPFRRIFNQVVDKQGEKGFEKYDPTDLQLLRDDSVRKYIGFMTTGQSRPVLYKQVLQKAAIRAADRVFDATLIGELSSLQARNGRLDHSTKGNDDMVFAWLLACYLVFEGKNLTFYGLNPNIIMQSITGPTLKSQAYLDGQMILRRKVKDLVTSIRSTDDEFIKRRLKYELETLTPHLDQSLAIDPVSVDAIRANSFDYRNIQTEIDSASKSPLVRVSDIPRAMNMRSTVDYGEEPLQWII